MGFVKNIRKNRTGPKDGSEPLTIITFSLTNDIRDSLKNALDAYIAGDRAYTLGQIIENHLPAEVLDEMEALNCRNTDRTTMYVVKNLPKDTIQIRSTYASMISEGVGSALKMKHEGNFWLERISGEGTDFGPPHKHHNTVTLLAGVVSDGSPTRFIDMRTLLEAAESHPGVVVEVQGIRRDWKYMPMLLKDFAAACPDWHTAKDIAIRPTANSEAVFWRLIEDHSQDVIIDAGDLVICPEEGRIFHQAIAKEHPELPNGVLVRYVEGKSFNRRI